jgi:hypothetical protein
MRENIIKRPKFDLYSMVPKFPKEKIYRPQADRLTAAGGTLLNLKLSSAKAVKIHAYTLQSEADSQTVYFYEEGTLKQLSQKWVFNAREGGIIDPVNAPFASAPWIVTQAVGRDIGLNLANATAVNYSIIYTNEDESIYR